MSLAEVEKRALALSEEERGRLAAALLETLPPPGTEVSDEEVWAREEEIESGRVQPISHEEFIRRVAEKRGP
jgi:hypothetical protein